MDHIESFDSILYESKNGRETRELWVKLQKKGPTLSQILLSIVDKTAYLEGSVRARILTNWQRLDL